MLEMGRGFLSEEDGIELVAQILVFIISALRFGFPCLSS